MDHAEVTPYRYGRLVVYGMDISDGEEHVKIEVRGMEFHGCCPVGDHAGFLANILDQVAWKLSRYQQKERDAAP